MNDIEIYKKITDVIDGSGIWDGDLRKTHSFLLTPDFLKLSSVQVNEIGAIGNSLYECLIGLGKLVTATAQMPMGSDRTIASVVRALRSGIPKTYYEIMLQKAEVIPGICKVDIMESEEGHLKIAEIDGHNKHGLGYAELIRRMCKAAHPEVNVARGAATILVQEARARGLNEITLLYGTQERFYLPEFRVLKQAMSDQGFELMIVSEEEYGTSREFPVTGLFVDFPFLNRNPELNHRLIESYKKGFIDFVIPPRPFFGSKAVLGLLRNETRDERLEELLQTYISSASLKILRTFIPETILVHSRIPQKEWQDLIESKEFVLKQCISSGMKGVFFPDEAGYEAACEKARVSEYHYILQRRVKTKAHGFRFFNEKGTLETDSWFVRITGYYAGRTIADLKGAARKDQRVHGAKDCLQLPITLS